MFIALILAFLIGVFSVLLFEAFLLFKWWTSTVEHPRKLYPERTKVINPEFIADYFKKDSATEQESCMSLNFLLAFLWREWRDSPKMKSFFLQKINSEFSELVKGKAASKLIAQITIDELSLGTSLPVIKGATVMKIGTKDPKEVPQELDIALELEYSGGCHMAIQVDLVFSKSVYIAVKLAHLRGRARLQFSRHPLTHWSLAFYEEPEVEFQAESQFEGKNLPQLTSLITSHLRKSLQKKHTLPSYNVRHSPFFEQLSPQDETQEVYVHNGLVTVGALEVTVLGCSRLPELENWAWQYCSLSVDLLPWSRLAESKRARWPTFEVPISRETNDISFGLTLSTEINEDDVGKAIVIETIVIDSPAYSAGVMAKDILVAIDGHKIESLKQAAKMIKNKIRFTATVQRPPTRLIQQLKQDIPEKEQVKTVVDYKNVALGNNSESEDEFVNIVVPLFEDADSEMAKSAVREMLSTSTELGQKAEKKQKLKQGKKAPHGAENKESCAQAKSGNEDQVTRDQKANGLPVIDKKQESPMILKKTSDQVAQEMDKRTVPSNGTIDTPTSGIEQASAPSQTVLDGPDNVKTKLVPASAEPVWNETVKFDILKNDQYLNVCIWSKSHEKNEKDLLLGYVTIPLMDIAFQCLSLSSKRHEQCYVLATPHSDRIISNQSYLRNHPDLKERLYCGDVTLIFRHMPSLVDCDETILEKVDLLAESEHKDESQGKDTLESLEPPKHQFILTQFHFPTRCSYCNKKVWTKVAFQCRICAMICHKKCLQSCMSYTHCVHASKSTPTWFSRTEAKSGNNFKKEKEGQDSKDGQESIAEGSSESELDRNVKKREKCSDKDERKLLVTSDQTETSEDAEYGSSDQIPEAEEEDWTTKENILKANDIAKTSERVREAGRELFCNLPPEVRKNKLEDMMNRLQVEIDEENGTQTELYEQRRRAKERKQKAVIESLLEKSEERSQALAMLMLQYCAGYQSCVEAEECDRYQL